MSESPYNEFMDDGMVEWCDRINAISGVTTLQSCAGHETSRTGESGYVRPGSLWFRAAYFTSEQARWLSEQKTIDQVAHLFGRGREPLWEVLFDGRNKSETHLKYSMNSIIVALDGMG